MAKQKRFNKFGNFGVQNNYRDFDCDITRQIGDSRLNELNRAKIKLAELDKMNNLYPFQREYVNQYKKNLIRENGILKSNEISQIHKMYENCIERQKQAPPKPSIHINKEMIDKLRLLITKKA